MSEKIKLPRHWPYLFADAQFSESGTHRYQLWRSWPERRYDDRNWVAFIGLNPSTADEHTDDRTVAGCCRRAIRWGHSGIWMLNLFGFVGTDPRTMLAADDPTGDPHCLDAIREVANLSVVTRVVLCWGEHGTHRGRAAQVLEMLEANEAVRDKLCYLKVNESSGQPGHPLYVAGSVEPKPWIGRNRIEVSNESE